MVNALCAGLIAQVILKNIPVLGARRRAALLKGVLFEATTSSALTVTKKTEIPTSQKAEVPS